jgi:hypothetical protein
MMQEVPKFVPVAFDPLKASESFTLRGRKTRNELRALPPIMEEAYCKPYRKARSKTDKENCPVHTKTPQNLP